MFLFIKITIVCSILAIATGNTLKCEITSDECKRAMYQQLYKAAAVGVPSLKIPAVDPIYFKNSISTLPNSVKLILEDGIVTGLKDCSIDHMKSHLEKPFHITANLTCNVEINGRYKVEVPKSVMEELGGEDLSGDVITGIGEGKATIEKLHLYLFMPFGFEWRNKDTYIKVNLQGVRISKDRRDLVVFSFTNLDVGQKANGEKIANYLKKHANELKSVAPITDKFTGFLKAFLEAYVMTLPTKDYYSSDISRFL